MKINLNLYILHNKHIVFMVYKILLIGILLLNILHMYEFKQMNAISIV